MLNSSSGDSCTSLLGGVISSISFDWQPAIINERDNKQKMIFFFKMCIRDRINIVKKGKLSYFAIYCAIAGAVTIACTLM